MRPASPAGFSLLFVLGWACVLPACSSPGGPAARSTLTELGRLSAGDPALARALLPSSSGFRRGAGELRGPPGGALDPRLALRADGPREIGPAGARLRLTPEGASASAAVLDEGRVVYPAAYPEVDAVLTTSGGRVEELFLLRSARAPSSFRWRLGLPEAGAALGPEPGGGLGVRDPAGRLLLRLPPAFALDARGERREAALGVEGDRLSLSLDTAGLAFPVLLDPAFEVAVWQLVVGPPPSARAHLASAYDSVRAETLVLSDLDDVLWGWDGKTWRPRASGGPGARAGASMAFDAPRGVAVLFGGASSASGALADTWEFDGAAWAQRSSSGPPGRRGAAMAYDSVRKLTLLFGGTDAPGTARLADTWAWDGAAWAALAPGGPSPPGRVASAMSFDTGRGRAVLYGGESSAALSDTWEWDGKGWSSPPGSAPGPLSQHAMAYDSARKLTLLFGGEGAAGLGAGTWGWDGATWSSLGAATPPPRATHAMAFDSARGRAVLFGGLGADLATRLGDTWEWDGAAWAKQTTALPAARFYAPLVYDEKQQVSLVYGGTPDFSTTTIFSDLWRWDGAAWSLVAAPAGPPPLYGHALSYDTARGVTVLFGGSSGAIAASAADTWEWSGAAWKHAASSGPPRRIGGEMVFDAARGVTMLFGGITPAGQQMAQNDTYGDTCLWDGAAWTCPSPPGSPSARWGHAMVYDPVRKETVLFGGSAAFIGGGLLGDTWVWDGKAWTERKVSGPDTRFGHRMAFDPVRQRVVLVLGYNKTDAWGWDGAAWTSLPDPGAPTRLEAGFTFDQARGQAVLFGGATQLANSSIIGHQDTWLFSVIGGGCASDAGCDGGHCVDGTCCASAACGSCQTCAGPSPGVCSPVTSADDPDTCTGPQSCDAAGVCREKPGQACKGAADCASGFCVSGVCCASACAGVCQACSAQGKQDGSKDGACGPARAGSDSQGLCPSAGAASCKTSGACDGKGGCALYPKNTPCGITSCTGNAVSGTLCDGLGSCGAMVVSDCAPYACVGASCAAPCATDAGCVAGFYCSAGACVARQAAGAKCASGATCASGFCIDGVCCDGACNGTCQACSAAAKGAGADGVCGFARSGPDPHGHCVDQGAASCKQNGACDGKGACTLYAAATPCGSGDCVAEGGGFAVVSLSCDGGGVCQGGKPQGCGLYGCSGSACRSSCAADADCSADAFCSASACTKKSAPGGACGSASTCLSGFCVDGVCCDTPCAGQCEACDTKDARGLCIPVSGAPAGKRPACAIAVLSDLCSQRVCDGIERASCQGHATSAVVCRAASCSDGTATVAARCDGKGACPLLETTRCEPFVCRGDGCGAAPCAGDQDCAAKFHCDAQKKDCVPNQGSSCDGDHTVLSPAGLRTDCSPYKCAGSSCVSPCHSIADCVAPAVCDAAGACTPPQPPPADLGAGCGCRAARAPLAPRAPAIASLAALALLLGRRRAPRRRAPPACR